MKDTNEVIEVFLYDRIGREPQTKFDYVNLNTLAFKWVKDKLSAEHGPHWYVEPKHIR